MGRGKIKRAPQKSYPPWTVSLLGEDPPHCRPGILDDVARYVYLHGQTAFLALTLHDRTEGQIWGLLSRRRKNGGLSQTPTHFAVEVEPGIVLDITGSRALREWNNFHGAPSCKVSREELRDWQRKHQPPNQWISPQPSHRAQYRLAESFADQLLRQ